METKNSIRKEKLHLRNILTEDQRNEKSDRITEKIFLLPCIRKAENVLCYVNYKSEVSTQKIIDRLFFEGKQIFLPRVNSDNTMNFYKVTGPKEVVSGYQGILEPDLLCPEIQPIDFLSAVMIMPGVAFSKDGSRIGYGKGFYDKYLEQNPISDRIGLCFSCQIAEVIPTDPYDKKATMVITEDDVIICQEDTDKNQ